MTTPYPSIGIIGGTFDPIHNGHLEMAKTALATLGLNEIRFIPCFQPMHRQTPMASPKHRLNMLKIALENENNLLVDEREINRQGPSYMIDTLQSLREEFPNHALCLILGTDSFATLSTWHKWKDLINVAHFIVVNRINVKTQFTKSVEELLMTHETKNREDLMNFLLGKIYQFAMPPIDIAGTTIREQLAKGKWPINSVPKKVLDYIKQNSLYQ